MKKLYTTPFGSRLYGTFDETSDWDWKFVVLPPLEELLIGKGVKNTFYSTSADTVKNTSEDTDTEVVPIQTFCQHFFDGQTYAIELAFGALQRDKIAGTELNDPRFLLIAEDLTSQFLTSNINAMVGYAYNQAQLYSNKGNRLDKLHQFQNYLWWLTQNGHIVPADKLLKAIEFPTYQAPGFEALFDKMLYITDAPAQHERVEKCFSVLEKIYPENITVAEAMTRLDTTIKKYGNRAKQAMENKGHDWKAISHAVRITEQALAVLNKHYVTLPFDPTMADFLKQIKYGNHSWEDVQVLLEDNIDQITALQNTTTLPAANAELKAKFDLWLKTTMLNLYGVSHVADSTA